MRAVAQGVQLTATLLALAYREAVRPDGLEESRRGQSWRKSIRVDFDEQAAHVPDGVLHT